MAARRRNAAAVLAALAALAASSARAEETWPEGPTVFEEMTYVWDVGMIHRIPGGSHPSGALSCVVGGGVAVEDFDGDGRLDLYARQSDGPSRFWLNLGGDRFEEQAAMRGLDFPGDWGEGVSLADYDNDGDLDVYLCNAGPNRMLRNDGDGFYSDVTEAAGTGDDRRCASASWADYDGDGFPDLFVANHFDYVNPLSDPLIYVPAASRLYRNLGDGAFADATLALPEFQNNGGSFIGTWFDYDNDGDPDLYVANDFGYGATPNRLFRNDGPGGPAGWRFTDVSEACGACNVAGNSMGVAVGDYDADGLLDLLVTDLDDPGGRFDGRHYGGPVWLLRNEGDGTFSDRTEESGILAAFDPRERHVAWGAEFLDYDNDADLDLFVALGGLGAENELMALMAGSDAGRKFIPRNATDLFNRGSPEWTTMFWDIRVHGSPEAGFRTPAAPYRFPPASEFDSVLAAQAMFPVTSGEEMRGGPSDRDAQGRPNELGGIRGNDQPAIWAALMKRLLAIPEYVAMFREAYPDTPREALGFQHAANALAAFQISAWTKLDAPWDRYLAGETDALTEGAKRGALLFYGSAGCAACHSGNLMTDQKAHNLAVPQIGPGKGAEQPSDFGRMRESGNPAERFAFRTPPLRNVAITGPWMHDGAFATLEEAVRHHLDPAASLRRYDPSRLPPAYRSEVQNDPATLEEMLATLDPLVAAPRDMSGAEMRDLLEFLDSLTSPTAYAERPPERVPSGLPVDS